MRVLTLTQPWASLVALGLKQVETRSWSTSYRGELAIHAAKGFPREAREYAAELCEEGILPERLIVGAVLAKCNLVDVLHVEKILPILTFDEIEYGDYSDGRYGWLLENIQRLDPPVPIKGALGLWKMPDIMLEGVRFVS